MTTILRHAPLKEAALDMRVTDYEPFVPPAPARPQKPVPLLDLLFGEGSRNPVAAWPEAAFSAPWLSRNILGVNYHIVSDPDLIRRVLVEEPGTYIRPRILAGLVQPTAGDLVTSEGETWRHQRRLMAPMFTPGAVAGFLPLFAEVARQTAEPWASGPQTVDVAAASTGAAFNVITRALFTTAPGLRPPDTARHVQRMMRAAAGFRPSLLMVLSLLDGVPRLGPGLVSAVTLGRRVSGFVAERRRDPDPPQDFVNRLLEAFGEDHGPDAAARLTTANALTFLVAGHETTANALAFTLYLLSEQPQAQAWAAEEAREALGAGGGPAEVLGRLVYLRWVLEEALRLYPPALRLERQAAADDQLGDLAIRKGDLVGVWPWILHRHQALWARPDAFEPENFAPEAKSGRHRFQYLPFGAGPRVCIGAQFATNEALLMLVEWLARYEFSPAPGYALELASDITLKPKGALPLIVRPREG